MPTSSGEVALRSEWISMPGHAGQAARLRFDAAVPPPPAAGADRGAVSGSGRVVRGDHGRLRSSRVRGAGRDDRRRFGDGPRRRRARRRHHARRGRRRGAGAAGRGRRSRPSTGRPWPVPAAHVRTRRPAPRRERSRSGAEERGEPRGQRLRPEGGEVVVEVAVRGGEDDGGEALRPRPGLEPGRGTPARRGRGRRR